MTSTTKVPLLVLLALGAVAACSGAKETELFGPPAQGAAGTTPIGGSSDEDAGSASSGEHAGGENGGASGGSSSSSGGGASKDAGAPPPPPPSGPICTAEVEPNNEGDRATPFMACVTGTLKKSDVDFVEIFAPANASKVVITHEETGGKVSYRVYINGLPFPSFTGDAPDYIPAVTGATYRFQLQPSGSGSAMRSYRLSVSFD